MVYKKQKEPPKELIAHTLINKRKCYCADDEPRSKESTKKTDTHLKYYRNFDRYEKHEENCMFNNSTWVIEKASYLYRGDVLRAHKEAKEIFNEKFIKIDCEVTTTIYRNTTLKNNKRRMFAHKK